MEVDVLAMGTPSVDSFKNSLTLHKALETDNHIKGTLEGLWKVGDDHWGGIASRSCKN